MKQIDYDVEQYQHYARGRALSERQLQRDPQREA
jgi:hypothetical protein